MDDRDRNDGERSADEIRREIERTRSYMDRTVEAIGDKLSPGRMVDELFARARSGEGAAFLAEQVKAHPLPFAVMGLGVGMLAMEHSKKSHGGAGTYERAEGRVGPYRGDAVDRDDPDWEHASRATRIKAGAMHAADAVKGAAHTVKDAAHSVKEGAIHLRESVGGAAHAVAEGAASAGHTIHDGAAGARTRVADAAHGMQERAAHAGEAVAEGLSGAADATRAGVRKGAEKTKDAFSTLLEENPLALAAIAFGFGMAAGLSAPSTGWEDERMGRRSDRVKDEVKHVATETAHKVKGVAQEAYGAAKEELSHQKEQLTEQVRDPLKAAVKQLEEGAKEVVHAAREAALDSAEAEELTGDGMKKMARRSRERATESTAGD